LAADADRGSGSGRNPAHFHRCFTMTARRGRQHFGGYRSIARRPTSLRPLRKNLIQNEFIAGIQMSTGSYRLRSTAKSSVTFQFEQTAVAKS